SPRRWSAWPWADGCPARSSTGRAATKRPSSTASAGISSTARSSSSCCCASDAGVACRPRAIRPDGEAGPQPEHAIVTTEEAARRAALWGILLPAAAIMVLTMGTRQVTGLFLSPINTATGIGVVGISFAMAVGQFVWGASQPVFGALADRWGPVWVMIAGGVMLALGFALTPFMKSEWGLVFTLGLLMSAGAGAG